MKYLKYFETEAEYASFKNGSDYVLPNVSFVVESAGIAFNPYAEAKETRVVCTYNITADTPAPVNDTSSILYVCGDISNFISVEIDGILQNSVTTEYTFNTVGEHTIKFELADPTFISDYAFSNCSRLASIVIPDSVTSIGVDAFYGCSELTSVVIPDGVTTIGNGAFYGCYILTSINIPDSVTTIGEGVFTQCYSLTSINIPDSVTSIGPEAFNNCSGLTSITIPYGVTTIGEYAFTTCNNLNEITCLAPIAPSLQSKTFRRIKEGGVLKVPSGSDYSSWMSTSSYYLGYYNWTVEYI